MYLSRWYQKEIQYMLEMNRLTQSIVLYDVMALIQVPWLRYAVLERQGECMCL